MPNNDERKKNGPNHNPVSDLILGSLKTRTTKDTSKWISGLADEAVKDGSQAAPSESAPSAKSSPTQQRSSGKPPAIVFTDQLFDLFQQYEFDFNKTVVGTDYVIVSERPTFVNETVKGQYGTQENVRVFRGRLSTRFFTLLLRATAELIEGWVMPVEFTFGFRADDPLYPPYVSIVPVSNSKGELAWKANADIIDSAQTRVLAKQLFAALIRHAKGEATEDERFKLSDATSASSTGLASTARNQPATGVSAELSTSQRKKLLGTTGSQALPSPSKPSKQTSRNAATRSAGRAGAEDDVDIDRAINSLKTAISHEVEHVTAAGAEAFAKQDMAQVKEIYQRVSRVQALQEELNQFLKQWTKSFQEALGSQNNSAD